MKKDEKEILLSQLSRSNPKLSKHEVLGEERFCKNCWHRFNTFEVTTYFDLYRKKTAGRIMTVIFRKAIYCSRRCRMDYYEKIEWWRRLYGDLDTETIFRCLHCDHGYRPFNEMESNHRFCGWSCYRLHQHQLHRIERMGLDFNNPEIVRFYKKISELKELVKDNKQQQKYDRKHQRAN